MKNHDRVFFCVLLASLAALGLTMFPSAPTTLSAAPTPPTTPVYVTNTGTAQAVPMSGQVSITGTPSVNIANTPTVSLASGATVQISNTTPVAIRDVDRPTAQPFNYHANLSWVDGFAFANADGSENFQVPAGKRLVIEFVSLQAQVPPGDNVLFARLGFNPGMVLTLTHAGTDYQNNESFTATHRVFAILEPGTTVRPTAFCKGVCTSSTSSLGMSISVSGYLVDAP